MSNSKLTINVDKAVDLPSSLKYVPIVITDSKGKYLRSLDFNSSYKSYIRWHCKRGSSSRDAAQWIS